MRKLFLVFTIVEWRAMSERFAATANEHLEGSAERKRYQESARFAERCADTAEERWRPWGCLSPEVMAQIRASSTA
jgi:hypothetical protein